MSYIKFPLSVLIGLVLVVPLLIGLAPAPEGEPCDGSVACFDTWLSPKELTGDFYLDGVLVAAGVNKTRLTGAPSVPHLIEVKNIKSAEAGFGDAFNYPDQSMTAQTKAGWIWKVPFYPRKNYLKGMLTYVCEPRGRKATDTVACRPTIDGATQADVAAGGTATYYLTPGVHTAHTDLVGASAVNWSTTARDDSMNIVGGSTTRLTAAFDLKGLLKIGLYPKGIVADIYVDGVLAATQSATAEVYVTPQVLHTVEARNVADPAAGGLYRYANATLGASAYAGSWRSVYLRPIKIWLTGKLSVYCQISRKMAADDAQCAVSADGTPLGMVPAWSRGVFNLPTGAHSVAVAVSGASAGKWDGPVSASVNVIGGGWAYYTARFNLRPTTTATSPVVPVTGGTTPGGFELGGQATGFSAVDKMNYAGMVWVKRQVRWSPGSGAGDGEIKEAHGKGYKVLLSVLGDPSSIADGANYDSYAAFVGDLAALGADAIEVWNEMNLDREWPTGQINPATYTDLLRRAYTQIKARNPSTMVISGAPSPTGAEGAFGRDHVWNDNSYIAGMAAAGAANYMDCIGAHYNEGIISPLQNSGDPRDGYYTRYYNGMVSTYYNAFGGARKICFTELGYLTPEGYGSLPGSFGWAGNTTVTQQAQWLSEAASLARSSNTVRMIIIFNVDFTHYGDDPQAGYAIIRRDGGCPACDALRNVTGGR